jgi:hypothetical protein
MQPRRVLVYQLGIAEGLGVLSIAWSVCWNFHDAHILELSSMMTIYNPWLVVMTGGLLPASITSCPLVSGVGVNIALDYVWSMG